MMDRRLMANGLPLGCLTVAHEDRLGDGWQRLLEARDRYVEAHPLAVRPPGWQLGTWVPAGADGDQDGDG